MGRVRIYRPVTTMHPYTRNRLKLSGEQLDDRVVEVRWDPGVAHWRMMRFRDDKPHGNHRSTVESVIESIVDGVEKETVTLWFLSFCTWSNHVFLFPWLSFSRNPMLFATRGKPVKALLWSGQLVVPSNVHYLWMRCYDTGPSPVLRGVKLQVQKLSLE